MTNIGLTLTGVQSDVALIVQVQATTTGENELEESHFVGMISICDSVVVGYTFVDEFTECQLYWIVLAIIRIRTHSHDVWSDRVCEERGKEKERYRYIRGEEHIYVIC